MGVGSIEINKAKVEDIGRHLICAICTDFVENPVRTPCHHIFCNPCILKALAHKSECPLDHVYLSSDQVFLSFLSFFSFFFFCFFCFFLSFLSFLSFLFFVFVFCFVVFIFVFVLLFCFVLFCFVLFCFVFVLLFCFVLFCFVLLFSLIV